VLVIARRRLQSGTQVDHAAPGGRHRAAADAHGHPLHRLGAGGSGFALDVHLLRGPPERSAFASRSGEAGMHRVDIGDEMRRDQVTFHEIVVGASVQDLRRRSNGTRWTNRQLLFQWPGLAAR
jgi:hypothetical protein